MRFFLDQHRRLRDRALFDLAIDSKLRGCDIVRIKIGELARIEAFNGDLSGVKVRSGCMEPSLQP